MDKYKYKIRLKYILLIVAVIIGVSSLLYTNRLVKELKLEEKKKVELWAEATQQLIELDLNDTVTNINFLVKVIENNSTVPVILMNEKGDTTTTRNLRSKRLKNPKYLARQVEIMKKEHDPIEIVLGNDEKNYIYYKDSLILTKLAYFPYVQLGVIILFILVAYLAFSSSRKFEQNQVWVGLTKETAHQLGTPTSSLMGWVNVLKMKNVDPQLVNDFEQDVVRLEKITERFSKVGSKPILTSTNVIPVIINGINYIKSRSSSKIRFNIGFSEADDIKIPLNIPLFEWVIENLSKNAIDAMKGEGTFEIKLTDNTQVIFIDFIDTGKGLHKSMFKTIFKPGFTSKERGWGLGLSLSKRIIEMYHDGKIFVLHSEVNKGTAIRIVLKK